MNNKTKQYDTVWSADDPDQEEFLSETDVEEGHEKQWHSDERPTGRRGGAQRSVWSTLRAHKGLVDKALLLVVIAMLGLLLLRRPQQSGGRQIGGDYMGAGPECQSPPPLLKSRASVRAHDVNAASSDPIKSTVPTRIVKWNADESFVPPNASEWFSEALLGKWNTMMPAGAALRSADEVFHTTTMTHSLHCLVSLVPGPKTPAAQVKGKKN